MTPLSHAANPGHESPSPQGSGRWPPPSGAWPRDSSRTDVRCGAARPTAVLVVQARRRGACAVRTAGRCTFQRNPPHGGRLPGESDHQQCISFAQKLRAVPPRGDGPWHRAHRPRFLPVSAVDVGRRRGGWWTPASVAETPKQGAPSARALVSRPVRWCSMPCFHFGPCRPKMKSWASWWRPGRVELLLLLTGPSVLLGLRRGKDAADGYYS